MKPYLLLPLGAILDALLGDPLFPPHPVVLMGKLIASLEKLLLPRCKKKPRRELLAGFVLVAVTLLACGLVPYLVFRGLSLLHPCLGRVFYLYLAFILLAGRSLSREAKGVYRALKEGTLADAQQAVGRIVGRDTSSLSREGVMKAAVETVAENVNDGIVAPLFYLALFGPLGMCIYKGINTMDSMVGYKSEKYLYFGRAAARLDDIAGFLPARLSAFLIMAACPFCGFSAKRAFQMFLRDRYQHESPNSAQGESTMAGALGIRLGGPASYFGKLKEKPYLGDDLRPPKAEDILSAVRIMWVSEALAVLLLAGVSLVLWGFGR